MYAMLTDDNRLSVRRPDLCSEWDFCKNSPMIPQNVSYCSHKVVSWICCTCGNKWYAPIKNRYATDILPRLKFVGFFKSKSHKH